MKNPLDNGGRTLYRLVSTFDPPAFVKDATDLAVRPAPGGFADPVAGAYPCHTAALTWLSAASFYLDGDGSEKVAARLDRFAALHQITPEVDAVRQKAAALTAVPDESTLPDSLFAFVGDGERHFPMRNPDETRKAAAYLVEHRADIPYPVRADMAARILDRASTGDIALGSSGAVLTKTAGRGTCPSRVVAKAVADRVTVSLRGPGKLDAGQEAMKKLALAVSCKPELLDEPGFAAGLAEAVDAFDRERGFAKAAAFDPIEDVLFAVGTDDLVKYAAHCAANGNPRVGPDTEFAAGRADYLAELAAV